MSVSVSIPCSHCKMGCIASRGGELPITAEHEERLTAHSGYRQRESHPGRAAETPLGSPVVWECHRILVPRALRDVEAAGLGACSPKCQLTRMACPVEVPRKRGCPQVGGTHVGHVFHLSRGISSQ